MRDSWDGVDEIPLGAKIETLVANFHAVDFKDFEITLNEVLHSIRLLERIFSGQKATIQDIYPGDATDSYNRFHDFCSKLIIIDFQIRRKAAEMATPFFDQLLEKIDHLAQRMDASRRVACSIDRYEATSAINAITSYRNSKISGIFNGSADSNLNDVQRVIRDMLDHFMELGIRKGEGDGCALLYQPKKYEGYYSYTYEPLRGDQGEHLNIEQYLYRHFQVNEQLWIECTKQNNTIMSVIRDLTNTKSPKLPHLETRRSQWSFTNGVFDVDTCVFTSYDDLAALSRLGTRYTSVKFIELPFEHDEYIRYADPLDVPTPTTDRVAESQQWDREVLRWFYVLFFGRQFFPLGVKDNWQTYVLLEGLGGTGKSSLLKLLARFFPAQFVGYISSKGRQGFPLASVYKSYLLLCTECGSLDLPLENFLAMVANEELPIYIMHKNSVTIEWNAPITFSGNSLPPFANTGDAVDRRTMCFRFRYSIGKVDTKLFNKSRYEMPAILYKSALLYRRALELVGDQEIWAPGILPETFHVNRQYLKGKSNPIYAVLYCKELVLRPDAQMTYADFKARLAEYCETYAITRTGIKDENFKTAFQHAGVIVCDPDDRFNEVYLRGVGVAPDAAPVVVAPGKHPRAESSSSSSSSAPKRAK
jgi:hypothetical protein